MEKENIAILLLGGKGERFSSSLPKQFIKMGGKELFIYPSSVLNESLLIDFIVYVVPTGYEKETEKLIAKYKLSKRHCVVRGGPTRQDSVYNALSQLAKIGTSDESIVLVQDGDRPNLKKEYISKLLESLKDADLAALAIPSTDSLCISNGKEVDSYLNRNAVFYLQTPQVSRFGPLFKYENKAKAEKKFYTDEGSLFKANNLKVSLVKGDRSNLKITEPIDEKLFYLL